MSSQEPQQPHALSAEEALIATRRSKADAVRGRGENPFANDLDPLPLQELAALRDRFREAQRSETAAAPPQATQPKQRSGGRNVPVYEQTKVEETSAIVGRVHVAGRIVFLRDLGKACFLRLRDRTGELQLFCKADGPPEAFAHLQDLDLGDIIEATGRMMVTKTGELSLEIHTLRLLTKALRPLPAKWHGLADVETRYRQRYVDLIANPTVASVFRARSFLVRALRTYLDNDGFLEVETPTLNTLVGGAAAKPFRTHHNVLDLELVMRIAPELYLKRLVVGGLERVYELGRCYRNEGISTRHNPEFTMLEFYEAYATYERMMERAEQMFRAADQALATQCPESYPTWHSDRTFTLNEPFARVPMLQAVHQALEKAGLPLDVHELIRQPEPPIKAWAGASARAKRIDWGNFRKGAQACSNAGEGIFIAYEYLAEPFLVEDYRSQDGTKSVPVFILDYPFEVSPLARRKDKNPALVDRFELFVDGREICNAFSELNDPDDQRSRFEEQVARKKQGAEETMDYDADYLRALEQGLPPTAGFGMGIDRLVMTLTNQPSIRDVILFPLLRPEG